MIMNGLLEELRIKFMEIGQKYNELSIKSDSGLKDASEETLAMIGSDMQDISKLLGEYLGTKK